MHGYQKQFIEFCIENEVIKFGEFTLKSGRLSPYFFNAGLFNNGQAVSQLGKFYAAAIEGSKMDFDILFGPAYKGIHLATTTAIALAEKYKIDKPFCFNRIITKDHGEGKNLIGAPLKGKVLIVDDVITAGNTINETIKIIQDNGASLHGVCVALNRQEKGYDNLSAIQEIEQKHNIKVISIITLQDLISYIKENAIFSKHLGNIKTYQEKYGVI